MYAFAWVVTVLVLLLIAQLILILPTTARGYWRERRFSFQRPRWRAVLILTVLELAVVLALGFTAVRDR